MTEVGSESSKDILLAKLHDALKNGEYNISQATKDQCLRLVEEPIGSGAADSDAGTGKEPPAEVRWQQVLQFSS